MTDKEGCGRLMTEVEVGPERWLDEMDPERWPEEWIQRGNLIVSVEVSTTWPWTEEMTWKKYETPKSWWKLDGKKVGFGGQLDLYL
jgi:hypothetical protein